MAKDTPPAIDPTQEALFREVDDDLRQEKLFRLWKTYGTWVIAGCVALVVGVGAFEGWQAYDESSRRQAGERFNAFLALAASDPVAADGAFRSLAEDGPQGYRLLAQLQRAALLAREGDIEATIAAYEHVSAMTEDRLYGDLALVLAAMVEMRGEIDAGEAGRILARLEPLTADDRPWRYTARELVAHLALRAGDRAKARTMLAALAEDALAPPGLRQRAGEALAALAGG